MKRIKNGGFTLVELLAVIVILGLVMTLALPIYSSVYNTIKNTTYNNKIKTVRMAALDYAANTYVKDSVKERYHTTREDGDWCRTIYVADLIRAGFIQSDSNYDDFIADVYTGDSLGFNSKTAYLGGSVRIGASTVSLCYNMNTLSVDAILTKDLANGVFYHKGETVRYFEDNNYYTFRIVSDDFIYNELLTKVLKALRNGETSVNYEGTNIGLSDTFDASITNYSENDEAFMKAFNLLIKKNFLTKLADCNH